MAAGGWPKGPTASTVQAARTRSSNSIEVKLRSAGRGATVPPRTWPTVGCRSTRWPGAVVEGRRDERGFAGEPRHPPFVHGLVRPEHDQQIVAAPLAVVQAFRVAALLDLSPALQPQHRTRWCRTRRLRSPARQRPQQGTAERERRAIAHSSCPDLVDQPLRITRGSPCSRRRYPRPVVGLDGDGFCGGRFDECLPLYVDDVYVLLGEDSTVPVCFGECEGRPVRRADAPRRPRRPVCACLAAGPARPRNRIPARVACAVRHRR